MKSSLATKLIVFSLFSAFLSSCYFEEDPGPLQYAEQQFGVTDFDRLEIGDAMIITVQYGPVFNVTAKGDSRNLDDLVVEKKGTTLTVRYRNFNNRRNNTQLSIAMPELKSAIFSGASSSTVSGVVSAGDFSLTLTGASVSQVDLDTDDVSLYLSGASNLTISGTTVQLDADVSGASLLKAYNLSSEDVAVSASGASNAYVRASKTLSANASGASVILYRGDATVSSTVTGGSTVQKD